MIINKIRLLTHNIKNWGEVARSILSHISSIVSSIKLQLMPSPTFYIITVTYHANRQTTQNNNDLQFSTLHTSFESE